MGRAFSPLCRFLPRPLPNLLLCRKSGVGLGWYSVAPSVLGLVAESATHLDHRHFSLLLCRFLPSPLPNLLLRRKSGVGLGWYSVAPSALGLVGAITRSAAEMLAVEESATHLDHRHF